MDSKLIGYFLETASGELDFKFFFSTNCPTLPELENENNLANVQQSNLYLKRCIVQYFLQLVKM